MKKIFILKEGTSDGESGVFRYDYLPSIEAEMDCDEFGFFRSRGVSVDLDECGLKNT